MVNIWIGPITVGPFKIKLLILEKLILIIFWFENQDYFLNHTQSWLNNLFKFIVNLAT